MNMQNYLQFCTIIFIQPILNHQINFSFTSSCLLLIMFNQCICMCMHPSFTSVVFVMYVCIISAVCRWACCRRCSCCCRQWCSPHLSLLLGLASMMYVSVVITVYVSVLMFVRRGGGAYTLLLEHALALARCWNLPQKGLRPNLGELI